MLQRYLRVPFASLVLSLFLAMPISLRAEEPLRGFDIKARHFAEDCRDEIQQQFKLLLTGGKLTVAQLFDTFYIPVPGTDPQKYHTQYDRMVDGILRPILDSYLEASKRFIFVVAVDRNGYLPTHNTRYSQPLTGDQATDAVHNRTKRLFNDRTGLAAARNLEPYLLQRYSRDTGEIMSDLSVPIYVEGQHWGALRIGYR